jgi:hypothetical protein
MARLANVDQRDSHPEHTGSSPSERRIGPYIEQLRDADDNGRFRSTHLPFPSELITETLVELHSLLDGRQRERRSWIRNYDRLSSLTAEIEEIVRQDSRPVDRILDNRLAFTNYDYWKDHHATWLPTYPHRILVDATITKVGSLSVRFRPECLGPSGQSEHAPEWRQLPSFDSSEPMKRPADEVLFIRNVDWLLSDNLARWGRCLGDVDRAEQVFAAAACRAVNTAFWLVVHRLSNRFEVHLGRYLAKLSSTADGADCLGLDIVDALAEHRTSVQEAVENFESDTGHTPQHFWEVCEKETIGRFYVKTSKALRSHSGAAAKLTPSVVEEFHNRLRLAKKYGFWQPGSDEVGEVAATEKLDQEPFILHAIPDRPQLDPQPNASVAPVPRKRNEPPDYSRLVRYAATHEELASAGVSSVDELVWRINAHAADGKQAFPISQFDFPNSKKKFDRLARLLLKLDEH